MFLIIHFFLPVITKIKNIGSIGADSLVDITLLRFGRPEFEFKLADLYDFKPEKSKMMEFEIFLTLHKHQRNYFIQGPER